MIDHTYDVVVVGAGGAGLRATLGMGAAGPEDGVRDQGLPDPQRIPSLPRAASARRWATWARTTGAGTCTTPSKGSDWLGDQDAIEYMCREAVPAVYELEHYGVPFSRTEDGRIYQRPFGGHMKEYGKAPAMRACAAADRTGHAILHTLYQQSLKHEVEFFVEYFALDLIMDEDGVCRGVMAWCLEDGTMHRFRAQLRGAGHRRLRPRLLSPAPRRTPAPATAAAWCCAPGCRRRTWSSCSSIPPASSPPAA